MKQAQHRTMSLLLALAILASASLILFSPTSAAAAEPEGGSGPDDALTPSGEWAELNPKADTWYGFTYAGDGSQIEIRLQMEPDDSTIFGIWTPDQVWHWGMGDYVEPVGRGSDDPSVRGSLTWSGSFRIAGSYYVVVGQSDSQVEASHYQLQVKGTGVSVAAPASTPEATTMQAASSSPAKSRAPADLTGKLVFQTTYGGPFYTINVDGSNLQRITRGIDPVWSPGGKQIAFVRWEDPRGVWVVDADGSDEQIVFAWHQVRYPSWSADGRELVFSRQHRGRLEEKEVCMVDKKGVEICFTLPPDPHYNLGVANVTDGSFWEPAASSSERSLTPDWSPAGDQIVYDDVYGLFVQSADGQTRYQLTGKSRDTSPVWSPDGTQVALVRRQHDHWEIYVVNADGSNLQRLTTTPALSDGTAANSVSPAWSPDGSRIAFLTDRAGKWEIWVMDADGANPQILFETELDGLSLQYAFEGERAIDWTR